MKAQPAGARAEHRAVRDRGATCRPALTWPLTPRELEVLGLVARGLSNAELAAALTLVSW